MDFQDLLKSVLKAVDNLTDSIVVKSVFTYIIAFMDSQHGIAAQAFFVLIFIDLFTRWLAICHNKLRREGKEDGELGLFSCLLNIPDAMRTGEINSDSMKHRFMGKIIVYTIFTLIAVHTDNMLRVAGEAPLLLKVSWIYLATTEGISILENLRDAGVEQAGDLLVFIRGRLSSFMEKNKK